MRLIEFYIKDTNDYKRVLVNVDKIVSIQEWIGQSTILILDKECSIRVDCPYDEVKAEIMSCSQGE